MTIEQSHGKARPTLPRASDLGTVPPPEPQRTAQRGPGGRFVAGNGVGRGKGSKRALARLMGTSEDDAAAVAVASAARCTYKAHIDELPDQGSIVSSLVAMAARAEALCAFFHAEGCRVGLGSPEGMARLEAASKHGQRAERLLVTALDVSRALAAGKTSTHVDPLDAYMPV
jgi:hypothetical protein